MAYASKYYDPVKAHEYYMKNRELRQRTSTAGLSEEGRNAAKYVRQQLLEEKKQKNQELKDAMTAKIKELRSRIKGISKGSARDKAKERIKAEIQNLRDEYKTKKTEIKDEYQSKYESELKGIRANYAKPVKVKKATVKKKKKK